MVFAFLEVSHAHKFAMFWSLGLPWWPYDPARDYAEARKGLPGSVDPRRLFLCVHLAALGLDPLQLLRVLRIVACGFRNVASTAGMRATATEKSNHIVIA